MSPQLGLVRAVSVGWGRIGGVVERSSRSSGENHCTVPERPGGHSECQDAIKMTPKI